MAALATATQNGPYQRGPLKGNDITIIHVGPEFGAVSVPRDFPKILVDVVRAMRFPEFSGDAMNFSYPFRIR